MKEEAGEENSTREVEELDGVESGWEAIEDKQVSRVAWKDLFLVERARELGIARSHVDTIYTFLFSIVRTNMNKLFLIVE